MPRYIYPLQIDLNEWDTFFVSLRTFKTICSQTLLNCQQHISQTALISRSVTQLQEKKKKLELLHLGSCTQIQFLPFAR